MNYICFKINLLYHRKGLRLFWSKERVNRLERSLQRHSMGLEFEYLESRIMDVGAGVVVLFYSGSV